MIVSYIGLMRLDLVVINLQNVVFVQDCVVVTLKILINIGNLMSTILLTVCSCMFDNLFGVEKVNGLILNEMRFAI